MVRERFRQIATGKHAHAGENRAQFFMGVGGAERGFLYFQRPIQIGGVKLAMCNQNFTQSLCGARGGDAGGIPGVVSNDRFDGGFNGDLQNDAFDY